ncbi:MAG: lamin tail domain-containing protein [Phycisphaerae bacterium]|nr:lamin tail domain-containing protein [Phycisphaerae bacterium]
MDCVSDFGSQAENTSWGRMPDAGDEWRAFAAGTGTPPTPEQSNGGILPEDGILITEIMYHPYNAAHPLVEDIREEYIELHNRGFRAVDLEGWRISEGVDYTFGEVIIGPGEYLAVAADVETFAAKYPGVTNVVGGWVGRLSNSGETIELTTAAGKVIDRVSYADQGEWARRKLGPVDYSHRGWIWADDHDGEGKSLELISMSMPNEYGQNWAASETLQGTPGRANSATGAPAETEGAVAFHQEHIVDIAPLIIDTQHRPIVPTSAETVTVTAMILDEQAAGITANLRYRVDGQAVFETAAMIDTGDSVFSGQIPSYAHDSVIEFYVEASDALANTRTWPAPVDVDGVLQQRCNALYQVDDSFDPEAALQPGGQPTYRIIMTEVERAELERIGSTSGEANSDAQMNATFISVDGIDTKLRYNVGVRNRGHGTRTRRPNNYRVNFSTDRPWKKVVAINLNTQYTWLQLAGSAIFQRSGLATGDARAVQVRVNGQNLAQSGPPQYGSYVHIEAINSEYADHQFPGNGAGNAYKALRIGSEADLRYEGPDPAPYRIHYFKETNQSQDDWSDLIELTSVLSIDTPDDAYVQEVHRVVNVQQWLRFLALNVLLDNSETTLANGNGDDYYMYRGNVDTRFVLVQHDLDSIFGQGQTIGSATRGIFRFMSGEGGQSPVAALAQLVSHPEFAPRYYGQLKDLIETNLSAEQLNPFLDNLLGGFVPQPIIDAMKSWQATRNAHVLTLIPSQLTIESGLPKTGDYYQTAADAVALAGFSDAVRTRSITVNGLPAVWSAIDARWSIGEGTAVVEEDTLISRGSTWRYLDDGSNQGTAWYSMDFDDSGWKGPQAARLGYGGDGETSPAVGYVDVEPGVTGTQKNVTTYFRREFHVSDPSQYHRLRLGVLRDDGAVVCVNGSEMCRTNMPQGMIDYATGAVATVSDADEQTFFQYSVDPSVLRAGRNVVAVEVHQIKNSSGYVTSSDMGFDLELTGSLPPGDVTGVPINPGITRVIVQAFDGPDGTGNEIAREYVDVLKDDSVPTELSGTLTQDMVLDALSGPYKVAGDLTVGEGVTLTIRPGATVYFSGGACLIVNGRLIAEGAEFAHIHLTRVPGGTNWGGLRFQYPTESPPRPTALREHNRITYTDMEYCDSAGQALRAINANVDIENVVWANHNAMYLDISDSSILVRNCVFPSITGDELVHYWGFPGDGYALFEGNVFGSTTGYNDIIDFTGGKLPGPIGRFINNIFLGGSDDGIDLDAADAWIEGNVFLHFHQDAPRASLSHAVSTGTEYGQVSNITVVRNLMYDVDYAFLIKDGAYGWFENNTVVHATLGGANFFEDRSGQWPGVGAWFDGNIFYDVATPFVNLNAQDTVTDLVVNHSIIPGATAWPGVGNSTADPLLTRTTNVTDPRTDFVLRRGSPAMGTGPNGLDMGGLVPAGLTITGTPEAVSNRTEAALKVGGPGFTHYRYRLNGASWSGEYAISDPIVLSGMIDGLYTMEVIGRDYAGSWQDETAPAVLKTWTVDSGWSRLVINEVLAHNLTIANVDGTMPDMVELYYDGPAPLSLAGMSLTDDPTDPAMFTFDEDTTITPGEYLILYADRAEAVDQIHLGFTLDDRGEGLYLYDAKGALIDCVEFGLQIAGLSIARHEAGDWRLGVPTFGAANVFQPLGETKSGRINEWFAEGRVAFLNDFVEFYNAADLPVDLGGLYITDNPVSQPEKHQIASLNFVPARGYAVFEADRQDAPGHLPFRLSPDQGMIALFESDNREIDWVLYGAQAADTSQGRAPDAGAKYKFYDIPSPGVANAVDWDSEILRVNLVGIENTWSYEQSNTALPAAWRESDYDDGLWPTGTALFYVETSVLPATKNTPLILGADTYYFRTHFSIDPDITLGDVMQLELSMVIDDAAVIWINGDEVARPGFDADRIIAHTTRADRTVGNAVYEYATIDGLHANLRPGDNVIAVEVHQVSSTSSDVVFGLAVDAVIRRTVQKDDPLENARGLMANLRVTELMYNPLAGSSFEFIELQNIGDEYLDLAGVRLDEGITFTFPEITLAGGTYVVVVNDVVAFEERYGSGINVAGEFSGNLSNSGENIVLRLPHPLEAAILRMEYSDTWYPSTDGDGYSLVIRDVTADRADWNRASSWAAGANIYGSPGAAD